ncbi:unnamed protein product [Aureobasidium pullulans]|nr:unnamed protein product [Aureobasidium pullulans]
MANTTTTQEGNGLYGIDNAANSLPALCACARGFLDETYDIIIIGGGTAGLAVAARLTEDPNIMVGVLEAGKSRLDDPLVDTLQPSRSSSAIQSMITDLSRHRRYVESMFWAATNF